MVDRAWRNAEAEGAATVRWRIVAAAILAAASLASSPVAAQAIDDNLVGLTRAIGVAERQLSARAIEGELDTARRTLVYRIDLVRGETLHRALVDARSGALVSVDKPRVENFIRSWVDGDRMRRGGAARPLFEQLRQLEQHSGGEVKEVAFEIRKGRAMHEVELATGAGVGKVHLDAATGQRIALAIDY